MTRLTILTEGSWEQLERAIQTARDYQATEIVMVGVSGMEQLAEDIVRKWSTFEIPIRIAEQNELITDRMLRDERITVFTEALPNEALQLDFDEGLIENFDIEQCKVVRLG